VSPPILRGRDGWPHWSRVHSQCLKNERWILEETNIQFPCLSFMNKPSIGWPINRSNSMMSKI
jgi:hypothetical protein